MWESELKDYRLCIDAVRFIHLEGNADIKKYATVLAKRGEQGDSRDPGIIASLVEAQRGAIRRAFDRVQEEYSVKLLTSPDPRSSSRVRDETLSFIRDLEAFVWACERLTGKFRETVRISAIDAAINFWIPAALRKCLSVKANDWNIQCTTREWWDVIEDVRDGHADFGVGTAMPCESLTQEVVLNRRHVAVFHESLTELAAKKAIDVDDFAKHGLICLHTFATPLGINSDLLARRVRMIRVNTCAQAVAWVQQGVGIALLTNDMISKGSGLKTKDVAFRTIDAADALYSRKPRASRSNKKASNKDEDQNESRDVMIPAAQVAYDAIRAYCRLISRKL